MLVLCALPSISDERLPIVNGLDRCSRSRYNEGGGGGISSKQWDPGCRGTWRDSKVLD